MTDEVSDYTELACATCKVVFWIPRGLWQTATFTRNDLAPIMAYCPYGHVNVARCDKKLQPEESPPSPPVLKKPWWARKKLNVEGNVIDFKGAK